MANPADKVTFDPKPILVGAAWALVATHALSGQREHVIGFHSETEAKEWPLLADSVAKVPKT